MATDAMKTRVQTFDANLTEQLFDDNFVVTLPDSVFYLQDEEDGDVSVENSADIPQDAEHGEKLQNDKLDADDTEFESFDKYIGAEFFVNDNGESYTPKGRAIGKQHPNLLMDTRA
jgi:hypothetical protein